MHLDLAGIALIITAMGAVIGPAVTAYLQIRAAKVHDADKQVAIAARDAQSAKLSDVHDIVNALATNGKDA